MLKNDDEDDGLTVALPLRFVSSRTRRKCEIVCNWLACYVFEKYEEKREKSNIKSCLTMKIIRKLKI